MASAAQSTVRIRNVAVDIKSTVPGAEVEFARGTFLRKESGGSPAPTSRKAKL
jgi:hypothetical protein